MNEGTTNEYTNTPYVVRDPQRVNSRQSSPPVHETTTQVDEILPDENNVEEVEKALEPADPENIFSSGGKNYRTLTKWDTVYVLVSNQIGLGILSLPACLKVLGVIPGIIAIIGIGSMSAYTAYELLMFYRKHPQVV